MLALAVIFASKGKIKKSSTWAMITLFSVGFGIATFNGLFGTNPTRSVLGDGGMYLLAFCILFCLCSTNVKGKSLPEFLDFLYKATFFSCAMSMLMYLTRDLSVWGIISYNSGRYFGGYLSLLIFTVPYVLYRYLCLKNIKILHMIVYYILAFSCLALAQSRTAFFAIGLGFVSVLTVSIYKIKSKTLKKVLVMMVLVVLAVVIFLNSNLDVVGRLLSTNLRDRGETTFARVYLYQYYIPEILKDPIGKGFGETMYFVSRSMKLQGDTGTYVVDCAYITAGYKGGWILLLVYILASLIPLIKTMKAYFKTNDWLYMLFAVFWLLYIFTTALITGQIIHTIATLTLFWVIVALSMKGGESAC
jgi:hypothetical protein